jgi:DNA-binding phage protein
MPTSRSYHSYLIESLKDPEEAAAYLDAVLEDCNYDELLLALRNVAEARIALLEDSQTPFDRELVQKVISLQTNSDFVALLQILNELGFKISVTPAKDAA